MALPSYVAAGTSAASTTTATPTVGTHVAGDLLILACETSALEAATATGWLPLVLVDHVTNSAGTGRGTLLYKITAGSEADPTTNDPGDHIYGRIFTFRGVDPLDPFHAIATFGGRSNDATTLASLPGLRTKVADCLILNFMFFHLDSAAAQSSAETNTSLANLTERSDEGTALGTGGGFTLITGEKATAGDVLPTTITVPAMVYCAITVALQPPQAASSGGGGGLIGLRIG